MHNNLGLLLDLLEKEVKRARHQKKCFRTGLWAAGNISFQVSQAQNHLEVGNGGRTATYSLPWPLVTSGSHLIACPAYQRHVQLALGLEPAPGDGKDPRVDARSDLMVVMRHLTSGSQAYFRHGRAAVKGQYLILYCPAEGHGNTEIAVVHASQIPGQLSDLKENGPLRAVVFKLMGLYI